LGQFTLYATTVLVASRGGLTAVCVAVAAFQLGAVLIVYQFLLHRLVEMPRTQILRDVGPAVVASALMFAVALPATELMSDAGVPALTTLASVAIAGLGLYALLLRSMFAAAYADTALLASRLVPARMRGRWSARRRKSAAVAATLVLSALLASSAQAASYPSGFQEITRVANLTQPVEVAWTPDGRTLIAEKPGRLRVVPPGGSTATTILDISNKINSHGDRGLLGIAVDPSFATNRFIYLLYTWELNTGSPDGSAPMVSRLTRLTLNPDNTVGPETTLLGSYVLGPCPTASNVVDCIPSDGTSHSIGTVRAAPDGTLWVGSGDAASFSVVDPLAFRTYDEQSFAGKILHIDRDGKGLASHPFCPGNNNLTHVCTKLFAKGFRNPYRFTLRPGGGASVADVGWNTWEEVNLISTGGGNYGWPCYEGNFHQSGYDARSECAPEYEKEGTPNAAIYPDHAYNHNGNSAAVISGPTYLGDQYPSGYRDTIFFGDYTQGNVSRLQLDAQGDVVAVPAFAQSLFSVALEEGPSPNKNLWYVSFGTGAPGTGVLREVVYSPGNLAPTANANGVPTSGNPPLTVNFSSAGSGDPDGDILTYDWDFDDGSQHSSQANPSHQYTASGSYTATLTVDDGRGKTDTDTVQITVGSGPPSVTIDEPLNESLYRDGQTIDLRASGTDAEDGQLPSSAFDWLVVLHHGDHIHTVTNIDNTATASFPALEDHDADSYYEITLTGTDSAGLTDTATAIIRPETVSFTLASNPSGAPVTYAGTAATTPFSKQSAIGFRTTISAAQQFVTGGRVYTFANWSDGGARSHDITIPATASTLTANYTDSGPVVPYSNAVLATPGLLHYWRMGETSGSTFADSKGASPASLAGPALGVPGALAGDSNGAARFDGLNDFASANINLTQTSAVTLEFWLKWNSYANNDDLAFELTPNYNSNPGGLLVDPNESVSGQFEISHRQGAFGGGYNSFLFDRPAASAWHHYALVFDKTATGPDELKAYVDGASVSGGNSHATDTIDGFAQAALYFMSRGGSSLFGAGDLDEVAVYNRALSLGDVQDHYQRGTNGGGAPPPNQLPTASFSVSPNPASTGEAVTFNGSASTDPDGTIAKYEWDLDGNGSFEVDGGTNPQTSRSYSTVGDVVVKLRVTDNQGGLGETTRTLTVQAPPPPSTYANTILGSSGLLHYWRMGEASGASFADSKGGVAAGVSGAALGVPGALAGDSNGAARFDGVNDFASANLNLTQTGVLTLEFWLKWNTFANNDDLAFELTPDYNANAGGLLVDPNESAGGQFEIAQRQGGGYNSFRFNRPAAAAWHHYALVFDRTATGANELKAYLDGAAVSGSHPQTADTLGTFAQAALYFMSRGGSSLFGAGDLDEVAVYNRALTAAEAADHYQRGTGGGPPGNQLPAASFTVSPNPANTGQTVTFNGSASSDPDGSITKYEWDLDGNGSFEVDSGTNPQTSRSYSSAGSIVVKLRVTDNQSGQAETTRTLQVNGGAPSTYASTILGTSGLLHYWRLGETSGSAFADSKGASPASFAGPALGVQGALAGDANGAARFDGLNDFASARVNFSTTGVLTLEFWLKWNAYANDDDLAFELTPDYNANSGGLLVDPNESASGQFETAIRQGPFYTGYNVRRFNRPSAAAWHHYALVFDRTATAPNELKVYVDGAAVAGSNPQSTDALGNFAQSSLYFMSRAGSSLFGAGDLDEVAVYNRALTAAEAQDHHTRGIGG
jgi:glucose/arabinose dehydrogenase